MCDTFVALGKSTNDGATIFGKNSDRQPNEPQEVIYVPRAQPTKKAVKCTYIEVPQVDVTNAVLLSKPVWIWGCEMGANEYGVVIGNEAVFTTRQSKEPGLLGMDLMRLALERGKSAPECMEIIIDLLEKFGQGGNAGFEDTLFYDNSYIIADFEQAWVLETAGRDWVAEKVESVRSISNGLTIEKEWDRKSAGIEQGTNFKKKYATFLYTYFSRCKIRRETTEGELKKLIERLDWSDAMSILRIHNPKVKVWTPAKGSMRDICVHSGPSLTRPDQSTGSLVSILKKDFQIHWFTGTSAPCTSIFKPFTFKGELPDMGPSPEKKFQAGSLWWDHEILHRLIIRDYPTRIGVIENERDELERSFINQAKKLREANASEKEWGEFSRNCIEKSKAVEQEWLKKVKEMPILAKAFTKWDKTVNKKCDIVFD